MKIFAEVEREWVGKGKNQRAIYRCKYPDGRRILAMGYDEQAQEIAQDLVDKYNSPIKAEIEAKAGGYKP